MENYTNLFTTERLIMEAWDPRDKATSDFLYNEIHSNPNIEYYATADLMSPRTRSSMDDPEWQKRLDSNPFKAIICLKPDNWDEISGKRPGLGFRGKPIGFVGMWSEDVTKMHHHSASMGISLSPEHQGKGYGTEAVKYVIDWAFRCANLHSLRLSASSANAKGIKAYEKAGFTIEGRMREASWENGKWEDVVLMSVLRGEWEETRKDKKST